jgi:O-antigen/teichoic acid export membrane protein
MPSRGEEKKRPATDEPRRRFRPLVGPAAAPAQGAMTHLADIGGGAARSLRRLRSDDLAARLLSGGSAAAIIKIASAGAAYAMFAALARLLPAGEYGRYAFAVSLALVGSLVLSFGLPVAALRFWPQHRVRGEGALARSFVARGLGVVAAGSAASAALLLVAAHFLTGGVPGYGLSYWVAVGAIVTLMANSEFVQSALRADGAIAWALAPRDVVWRLLVIATCFAAGRIHGLQAVPALWLTAACLFLVTLPQIAVAIGRMGIGPGDLRGPTHWRAWASAAWPMWGSAVLTGMAQHFDVVLLGMYVGPEATGPYFAALRTATMMTLVLFAANMVGAPLIAEYYHGADRERLRRLNRLMILAIAVPTVLAFLCLAAFGRSLLAIFDPSFVSAYPPLLWLGAGFALSALAGPVNYFMQMVGLERRNLAIQAGAYAAVVAAQCYLAPRHGALGVAIPGALGAVAASFGAAILLRRTLGVDTSVFVYLTPARRLD